jgi:hypothetical protein
MRIRIFCVVPNLLTPQETALKVRCLSLKVNNAIQTMIAPQRMELQLPSVHVAGILRKLDTVIFSLVTMNGFLPESCSYNTSQQQEIHATLMPGGSLAIRKLFITNGCVLN